MDSGKILVINPPKRACEMIYEFQISFNFDIFRFHI